MSDLALKSWNHAKVRCFSGCRANERPISFLIDSQDIEVRRIMESWREPDYLYFKVETHDGRMYDLRHHEYEDSWLARERPTFSKVVVSANERVHYS